MLGCLSLVIACYRIILLFIAIATIIGYAIVYFVVYLQGFAIYSLPVPIKRLL
jgi:hypothetical protein